MWSRSWRERPVAIMWILGRVRSSVVRASPRPPGETPVTRQWILGGSWVVVILMLVLLDGSWMGRVGLRSMVLPADGVDCGHVLSCYLLVSCFERIISYHSISSLFLRWYVRTDSRAEVKRKEELEASIYCLSSARNTQYTHHAQTFASPTRPYR